MRKKSESDIAILKEAGAILASVLRQLEKALTPGVRGEELDQLARELIKKADAQPSFLGYAPRGQSAYPAALCLSLTDEVVHGLPAERTIPDRGLVKLDLGLEYRERFVDLATTIIVGEVSDRENRLVNTTRAALDEAIGLCRVGHTLGDIGSVISDTVRKSGFRVVQGLSGHAVGFAVHETPLVPNEGRKGEGERLEVGTVLAIEPMATLGNGSIYVKDDGWTVATLDHQPAAHFEHTVAVTKVGPLVLTS